MDIKEEREAFNKEFGINNADTFPAFSGGIESSAVLKCNWLGWKKRAELECRENPEKIEIEGLKTIHKLCKFGADHNMEGCSFTEIVERMFSKIEQMKTQVDPLDEMLLNQGEALAEAKAQAVPEGFVEKTESNTHHYFKLKDWDEWTCIDGIKDAITSDNDINAIVEVECLEVIEISNKPCFALLASGKRHGTEVKFFDTKEEAIEAQEPTND